ncbi:tyrosine-type recombinase/integrase [Hoeflea alexandrii]|uniref:Integrase arm-type DNA-binding domain-containing protein n=1 Tax=Hoeflea alexandrii TaxID=288436 RepID=A0ABT1CS64_9HYPH|nr:site-specific integrase [Hoeflea alexandrii]MCO6409053.1 integrase arm-type DNA-binding domain-containing protein [Hoeflea alexandrii]MCY0151664.1 integrase arm-type DNA-binding domain-containing protein [Hoeflea alexandrii]
MARAINKLTDTECKAAAKPGMLGDGGGLYLNVKPSGAKSWAFIWKKDGKRNEMGLGAYPAVKLAKARALAAECRQAVAEGRNPIDERKKDAVPAFGECADMFLASMEGQWRNEKHRAQWRMTLEQYASPLRAKSVADISTDDVLKVLTPIWQTKAETASRLRGRMERVLDYAKARGWRTGENPALWRGHLKNILPARQKLTRGHHAAMPYKDVPAFIEPLPGKDAMAARGLEFLILTAARSGEVLGATWQEMDLENAVWTIPAKRMKSGKEHRVPLSPRALAIVKALHETRISDFVFPGQKQNRPLSGMAFEMLMRRMKADTFTVHGFRSAFRDWVGDETQFPRDIAEQALAHRIGDATERAYRRGDALEKRRKLMTAWADHCESAPVDNVISLVRT